MIARRPLGARLLIAAVITAGTAVAAWAVFESLETPLAPLALLAAGVVLTELIRVPSDEGSLDPADSTEFSFSAGVHIAAVVIVGPWAAALIAVFGVVLVDGLRDVPRQKIAYNASVFALAVLAGGVVFELFGGSVGSLALPADFPAVVALGATAYVVNTALVSAVVALTKQRSFVSNALGTSRAQILSAAGELGLGLALALFATTQPLAIIFLAPLVLALYEAHRRLALLRRETSHALETFANVVDERDPLTYRHSERVAEHVRSLAESLGVPAHDVARVWWAGRLHDLGKIAVDSSVLRKHGALSPREQDAMRRHPRLSARLLRRFRLAGREARAVEYHHERFDGGGYYGLQGDAVPLAAHLLIVADSYDAMTTDRPYRPALGREEALAEIEAEAGTQFHPALARAFVALQRGVDPASVLTRWELRELRAGLSDPAPRSAAVARRFKIEAATFAGVLGGLCALAASQPGLALIAFVFAAGTLVWRWTVHLRATRLSGQLQAILADCEHQVRAFDALAGRLAALPRLRWIGLVGWQDDRLNGTVLREWRPEAGPPAAALVSWLVREAEASNDVVAVDGSELGRDGEFVCVRLNRNGRKAGFLVVAFARAAPPHVELALRRTLTELASQLARPAGLVAPERHLAAL